MKVIAFDTETHLITPGCTAPKLVCVSVALQEGKGQRGTGKIFLAKDGLAFLKEVLQDKDVILTGHHTCFDLGVICAEDPSLVPLVFQAIDEGRLADTLLRQKIIDNALGELKFVWNEETFEYKKQRYGLAFVVSRLLGRHREKGEDTWRLRYNELEDTPVADWPKDAQEYAEFDAEDTMAMYLKQSDLAIKAGLPSLGQDVHGERWQMEASWSLYLASMWGMRTDGAMVKELSVIFSDKWETYLKEAQLAGFVREDVKRSKDTKAIALAVKEYFNRTGSEVPRTPTGKVSLKRDVLVKTDNSGLLAVAEMGKWRKLLTTYIPVLEGGTEHPINCSFNPILETYRTSCSRPNIQNLPRVGNVRECFVPREGSTFVFCDYDTLEMRSLAQVCIDLFGYSSMADALREGKDLHLDMAAEIAGIEYEEAQRLFKGGDRHIKELRRHAKPANFGFPGGMGPSAFRDYAAQYGVELNFLESKELKNTFMRKWPEMDAYFQYCTRISNTTARVDFIRSDMIRGDVSYTAICNGFFQHLAAMGAKRAMYESSKACYTTRESPLYGCRPVAFIHDEIGVEVPSHVDIHDAGKELERIMIETMSYWIPDIPITCEPFAMKRWYKGADSVYKDGRLVPWEPKE